MRKSYNDFFEEHKSYPKYLMEPYSVRQVEDEVVNNRVMKRTTAKVVNPADVFAPYKTYDFALENLIAVGALDKLGGYGFLDYTSKGELSDSVERSFVEFVNNNEQKSED